MEEKYIAAMVLAGVGDAMGYKNGSWEFCFDGEKIHNEVKSLGGVKKLVISKPNFIVSDDTVLLLATADALIEKAKTQNLEEIYSEIAFHYKQDFVADMCSRAGGLTTASSCHALRPSAPNGWQIPFNPRGGGCGAAMRTMCIGLRYPNIFDAACLEKLIAVSVESGRMTHNHPTGFLGSFATALFGAMAIQRLPLPKWGSVLLSLLPKVLTYVKKEGRDVEKNEKAWSYFQEQWQKYLTMRNLLDGKSEPVFPNKYGVKDRDAFYKSLAYQCRWGGASGHDAPMIAYDALLYANDQWKTLCKHGMLHSGDNDSTGVIAGFCYGAMYGFKDVPDCNYKGVEYSERLTDAGRMLYQIASTDGFLVKSNDDCELPVEKLFLQ